MWRYNYLRADREEIEMGAYATEEEAKMARDTMVSFGALCSEPFEVPGEAPSRIGYVDGKVEEFRRYFFNEVAVLATKGITYHIFYDFLATTIRRIKLVINGMAPHVLNEEQYGKEKVKEFASYRAEFLLRVAHIIQKHYNLYGPIDGSTGEDAGKSFLALADEVKLEL